MRTILSVFSIGLLALASACGGSSTPKSDLAMSTMHPADMSAITDFAGSTADLTMGTQACATVLECAEQCDTQGCVNNCLGMGTSAAQTAFNKIFACAAAQCGPSDMAPFDGGPGSCSGPSDTTAACAACIKSQASGPTCGPLAVACLEQT